MCLCTGAHVCCVLMSVRARMYSMARDALTYVCMCTHAHAHTCKCTLHAHVHVCVYEVEVWAGMEPGGDSWIL